mgnify:FL=1
MSYLTVAEGKQIYFEHYPGSGPTVVLSHGYGMSGQAWANTVARLMDAGRGVVVYDHRCCGRSEQDFADASIEVLGDDLVALVNHLELSRVVVNGWSLGGAVVMDAAGKLSGQPGDRLAGVVPTGGATPRYTQTTDFPYGGQPADVEATIVALRADRVNFLKALYFDGVFASAVTEDVKRWCWQISLGASPGADASMLALANLDQRETLKKLSVPVLVCIGSKDGVLAPDIARAAAEMASDGRLLEMPECGHAPFLEDPETYHDALLSFIDEVSHA